MLRILTAGRIHPPLPWELFVALGGGFLLASGLLVVTLPRAPYAELEQAEMGLFAAAGLALLFFGLYRRRSSRARR